MRLKRPGNPRKFFSKFLDQHQQIKSLVISDASQFNLKEPRFYQMVFGLRQLDRLCIGFGKRRFDPLRLDLDATKATTRPKTHLKQLSLEGLDLNTPVSQLLSLNTDTLVTLNLVNTGHGLLGVFDPITLPNLKNLRMTAGINPRMGLFDAALDVGPPWIEMVRSPSPF